MPLDTPPFVPPGPADPHAPPPVHALAGGRTRVLLAAERRLGASVARRVLEEAGRLVTTVDEAHTALTMLRAGDADLLITEHTLRGMEPGGLVRAVRDDPSLTLTPVIVLATGDDARGEGVRALEHGADDYLTTPVEPAELRARVNAALRILDLERQRLTAMQELARREVAYRELAMEQGALRRVAAAVAAARPPGELFALVAREVAALLGTEGGGVARFDHDSAYLVGAYSADESLRSEVGMVVRLDTEGVTGQVYRTGRPARVDDYRAIAGGSRSWRGRRSSVAAPVTVGGSLWGTVGAVSIRPRGLPPEAERRLARFAELVALAIGNAQSQAHIEELAMRDHLTGVYNRRAFDERLAEEVSEAVRHGNALSLLVLDVDRFKRVNDTFGHQAGDRVLTEVARRVLAGTRTGETLARVGGEEFGLVLPHTSAEGAAVVAERVRRLIAGNPFPAVGTVTVSLGVADLAGAGDAESLFRNADQALYEAKQAGRNRVAVRAP